MLLRIVSKLWFSPYKDQSFRNSQKRLLAIMVFSVAVLIAVGAIFSGFEQAISRWSHTRTKDIVLYSSQNEQHDMVQWLRDQKDIEHVEQYGRQMVSISCKGYVGLSMVIADPQYRHNTVLISPLVLQHIAGCQTLHITGYDLSQIFPIPHTMTVRYKVHTPLGNTAPLIIVSPAVYKALGYSTHNHTMAVVSIAKDNDIHAILSRGPYAHVRTMDMSVWQGDFAKALHSQKIIMWTVLGLILILALFQLKHFLEDIIDHQKLFWALMCLHGVSRRWLSQLFAVFVAGFVIVTIILSIPVGILLAALIDPLIHGIEAVSGYVILDPEFFILDYVPYAVTLWDILVVEGILCVMASFFTYRALRRIYNIDVMLVLRNG